MRLDQLQAELDRLARARGSDRATCPDVDRLRATADLSLPPPERAQVLDHVTQCPACRREFDLLRTVVVTRDEMERAGSWRRWAPLAAAAVAVIGIGVARWLRPGADAVRGDGSYRIEIVAPTEHVRASGQWERPGAGFDRRLVWRPGEQGTSYAVTLLRNGLLLARYTGLTDTVVVLPDSVRLDPPARFEWFVEGTRGASRTRSRVHVFTLP